MRSSIDDQTYVSGYDIGSTIEFKAGFKVWGTSTTGAINGGKQLEWFTYTIIEDSGAIALTASLAVSLYSLSLLW